MEKRAKQGAKKKRTKAYKMPDPLPKGEVLQDIFKKKWRLGISIGKGGFGEIYSAQPYADETKSTKSEYSYVIKIEPHQNGPLFVEMHFYMRNAKKADIDAFKSLKRLQSLGMPVYIGSGSHEHKGEKYRFVVMEKYGSDVWKLYLENNRSFPATTVYRIGLQMLDILEYIHGRGYIHGDIKGANVLLSLSNPNQTYLVDFGLAEHYNTNAEFKPNPKKAHNGTIEYLSRDAHTGVQTRRGDLEILIYNLIQWLGCVLPWEGDLNDVASVQKSKEKCMSDTPEFLKTCFGERTPPDAINEYLRNLATLKFNTEPDYQKFRDVLLGGLKSAGGSLKTPLQFKASKKRQSDSDTTSSSGKKPRLNKKKNVRNELVELQEEGDAKVGKRIAQKKHSKKAQVSSSDEDVSQENDDGLPQKKTRSRNQLNELVELQDEGDAKVGRRTAQKKHSKKAQVSSSDEDVSQENDDGLPQKKTRSRNQLTKNKVKKKLSEPKEEESDDERNSDDDTLAALREQKGRKLRRYNKKPDDEVEEVSDGKSRGSDDSDMSTYTDEMKRIKNKMKVTKLRKQKIKKRNDTENGNSIEDIVPNSDDEEVPVLIARKRRAKK